jgi:pimeloyl-ACP methyl ester carboxylesterase
MPPVPDTPAGSRQTRLVLLPGLGADEQLFAPQRKAFPTIEVPAWLDPAPGETLAAFAARMARPLEGGRDLVLGGVSFGGMVALEMARLLQPRAVVLIASCRSGAVIRRYMRALAHVGCRLPIRLMRPSPAAWPVIAWGFGAKTAEARDLIRHFLETRSPAFVQWGLAGLLGWRPNQGPACPVFHIHGEADRLSPAARVSANRVVPGAGHLLNVTHADEVNAFLSDVLRGPAQLMGRPTQRSPNPDDGPREMQC